MPPRPIHKLADFVFFSHARHGEARIDCQACHGAVGGRDVVEAGVAHTMKACMDCHRTRKATLVCTACHELGQ